MDAYALFDALTDVRDGFLEETERRLHGKKRRRVGVYLLAAVLIVLLCFSSAVALDADFRQRVLSLFQVAEVVPRRPVRLSRWPTAYRRITCSCPPTPAPRAACSSSAPTRWR